MAELAPDDPLNAFHEIFHRHVAVIQRFGRFPHRNKMLQRRQHRGRGGLPRRQLVPLRSAAVPPPGRRLRLRRHGEEAHREAARPRIPDPAAGRRRGAARRLRVQVPRAGQGLHAGHRTSSRSRATSASATSSPTSHAETSMGPIDFHDFIGDSWCVLFSHPADFTPVCTTEFGVTAKLEPEWRRARREGDRPERRQRRGPRALDRRTSTRPSTRRVNFPIIADKDRRVSMLFGMLDPTTFRHGDSLGETMTVRSVFIISPAKRVELIISYPAYIGRSFDEILRVLDALQLSAKHRVATPANWRPGRGHGRAAVHLRRGGRAHVRRAGRLPQGALLLALRARSVASLPVNCRCGGLVRPLSAPAACSPTARVPSRAPCCGSCSSGGS